MRSIDGITGHRMPVVVYDVTIDNIEDRRKAAKSYDTLKQACQYLGLSYSNIKTAISTKRRVFSPSLNKEVAIRLKPIK